ncbi:MAG: ComEA family DNA-binding protein [Pseudobutyrivibrio sp.]|nr:ComEA family DNA-binding protein [Pseudobutyrivibrio sp.]
MKKLFLLSLCSLFFLCSCGKTSYMDTVNADNVELDDTVTTSAKTTEQEIASGDIYVHISGAVNNPGVYKLSFGSRVYEVVEAAGGLASDADDRDLNQAAMLSDGEKIYVFSVNERTTVTEEAQVANDGKVSINTASADELKTLSGIGQSKADNIVAYRQQNGDFSSLEDIMQVTGIGQGIFAQIKDSIKL